MKRFTLLFTLVIAVCLSCPALAEAKPDKVPPGQAKKMSQNKGHSGGGPPPWAPAHGRRGKHNYVYYPESEVYHEPENDTWFWLQGDGWEVGAKLPDSIELHTGGVSLEMDADQPYEWHTDVRARYHDE